MCSKTIKTVKIEKTVSVDVDADVEITSADILEALEESDDMEEVLRDAGFRPIDDMGLTGSLTDSIKLQIIRDILLKATISQLESFEKLL